MPNKPRQLRRPSLPVRNSLRLAILTALSAAPVLQAATVPPGTALDASEFLVNTYASLTQDNPRVARDAAGDFVVVWQSLDQNATSGNYYDIYAQRYNAAGQPQGSEFLVNVLITSGEQMSPVVAMDAAGDFVVAWENKTVPSGGNYDIYARQYHANGTPLHASEFLVNTYTAGEQEQPSVAMDAAGDFVIAWQSYGQASSTSGFDIYARQYHANGTALQSSEFLVDTSISGTSADVQTHPAVAMDMAGDFVVAWQRRENSSSIYDVYARQFNAAGSAVQSSEFLANTHTSGFAEFPAVAMDAAGDFVIAWQSYGQANPGISSNDIYARQYNAFGTAQQPSEFLVNTTLSMHSISSDQSNPAVAMDAAGDFVVAWQHNNSHGGSFYDVFARQFNAAGSALQASEFLLNTFTSSNQSVPAVAMDAAGDFVAAWQSYGQASSTSGIDVYARRYEGLETVDLMASLVSDPGSVTVGNSFSIDLSVDNGTGIVPTGNSTIDSALTQAVAVNGVTATFTLPQGLSVGIGGGGVDWTCGKQTGATLICDYSASILSGGAGNGVTLFFTPTTAGTLTFKATVSATQPQTGSASTANSASTTVTVKAASSGGGGSSGGGSSGGGGSFGLFSLAFLGLPLLRRRKPRL